MFLSRLNEMSGGCICQFAYVSNIVLVTVSISQCQLHSVSYSVSYTVSVTQCQLHSVSYIVSVT